MITTKINPGELNDELIILGKIDGSIDEDGFAVEGTQELFRLACKKKTVSTREFLSNDQGNTELVYKFICPNENIDNTMLINYSNRIFNIKHIHEVDSFFLEITASESISKR
jgi:head-tail adaptor